MLLLEKRGKKKHQVTDAAGC